MPKEKLNTKLIRWAVSHPWLKLIALMLAIITWFYAQGEISRFNY